MTRAEKLAEARRLLDYVGSYESRQIAAAIRLTLDLIEGSESGSLREKQPPLTDAERAASVPFAVPESAALSPTPDFAAMAEKIYNKVLESKWQPIDIARDPPPGCKLVPALVRDEAWWIARMREFWDRYNDPTVETTFHDTARHVFAKYLGADPAPAFDVEALIAILYGKRSRDSRFNLTMNADAIRDAAREMLKGGVK